MVPISPVFDPARLHGAAGIGQAEPGAAVFLPALEHAAGFGEQVPFSAIFLPAGEHAALIVEEVPRGIVAVVGGTPPSLRRGARLAVEQVPDAFVVDPSGPRIAVSVEEEDRRSDLLQPDRLRTVGVEVIGSVELVVDELRCRYRAGRDRARFVRRGDRAGAEPRRRHDAFGRYGRHGFR